MLQWVTQRSLGSIKLAHITDKTIIIPIMGRDINDFQRSFTHSYKKPTRLTSKGHTILSTILELLKHWTLLSRYHTNTLNQFHFSCLRGQKTFDCSIFGQVTQLKIPTSIVFMVDLRERIYATYTISFKTNFTIVELSNCY